MGTESLSADGAPTMPWPIISVDDHLIEPPDLFEGRMPSALADRAPRIVEDADGTPGVGVRGQASTRTSG